MATVTAPRKEYLVEFTAGVGGVIDKEAHVIRGVKLLGLESRNGRRYLESAVKNALRLYENAKVNVNHPKGRPDQPRDYQDRLGTTRNVQYREGQGIYGDLHYNPAHPVAAQLEHDAENSPESVGLSHNVEARTSRRDGKTVVESIVRVQSVDLVADPATTGGLFEHEEPEMSLAELTLEQICAERQDIKALVEAQNQAKTELESVKAELSVLKEAKAAADHKAAVESKLIEAGIEITEGISTVACSLTEDKLPAYIESLQSLVKKANVQKPQSKDQNVTESTSPFASVTDTKSFVAAMSR